LSANGADQSAVPRILDGLGPDEKVELLRQNALDYTTVPSWQTVDATTLFDQSRNRFYVLRIGCTSSCFKDNQDAISQIATSWKVVR
jgi:hypothetical protein